MTAPRFAAVVPAHNALPDVLDAVASALAQTLAPVEIVVVDDRSSDGTGDAVESRFGRGGAVRVVRGSFGGAAAARNAGWRAATAPWIAFLDADDLWFPQKLETAAAALAAVPAAGWFFSDGAFRDLDGALHASWLSWYADLPDLYAGRPVGPLLEVNFVLTSSVIARRDLLESLGGFDETMSHAEDVDLWIRLARRAPAAAARRALVRYQHRPGGLTRQVQARLDGDVALFRRLAADPGLEPPLRARAREREALAHYKLAFAGLRSGDHAGARGHLRAAWTGPRAGAVAGAWLASWLPPSWLTQLRGQSWAKRGIVGPSLKQRRVRLELEPELLAAGVTVAADPALGAPAGGTT